MSGPGIHRVLIADDEESLRFVLRQLLEHEGCEVAEAATGDEAWSLAAAGDYDLYVFDMKMPGMNGLDVLRRVRERDRNALVVMMTAFGSQKLAIEALQAGAYDYFTKPFEIEELRVILRRALEKQALLRKVRSLERKLDDRDGLGRIVGRSAKMQQVYELVRKISGHDITVLITGESGSGKEMIAEAVHNIGFGPDRPFVRLNCAAIPEALLESELFGHEKGAFTGAVAAKPGKFELADGGSILLDEIGEMPLSLQAKLLRVLQEKVFERVGGTRPRAVEVRIMASTNRDLAEMVAEKTFREDLYFRINVLPIHVPALRDRIEDLPALVEHFLAKYSARSGKTVMAVTPDALRAFEAYAWPGNVRELENVIHRAMIMSSGSVIDLGSLPPVVTGGRPTQASSSISRTTASADQTLGEMSDLIIGPMAEQVDRLVGDAEKRIIIAALDKMNHRRQDTADLLKISRKSLHNKMSKYGLLKA